MALVKPSVSQKEIEKYTVFISPNPSFLLFPEPPTLFPQISRIWSYFPKLTTFTGASWNELLCCAAGAGNFGIFTTKKGGNAWFLAGFNTLKPGFRPPLATQIPYFRLPRPYLPKFQVFLICRKHNQISLICRNPWPPPPPPPTGGGRGGCPLYSEGARFQKKIGK